MSKRDCGSWYCQKAAGFQRLPLGDAVRIFPGRKADDNDKKDLRRERTEVNGWFHEQRVVNGYSGWLAGPGHRDGAAREYWVWDPDSRAKYMEFEVFIPGSLPADWGELHRGRGWQLPLLAVFTGEPHDDDIRQLRKVKVPFTVLGEPVADDTEPEEPQPEIDSSLRQDLIAGLRALLDRLEE